MIVLYGLPFKVLSVLKSPTGWNICVRSGTGGLLSFTVPDGPALEMRAAIHAKLEA